MSRIHSWIRMTKSKSRFYAAKQAKARWAATSACQAPAIVSKEDSHNSFRETDTAEASVGTMASTDLIPATAHDLPVKEGHKARNKNPTNSKRLLVGSSHIATTSLDGEGSALDNVVSESRKRRQHKIETTVEKAPEDYGDDRMTTVVYIDGTCSSNGEHESAAGIGIWWGLEDERNFSERCPGLQTKNRAEIFAAVRLLEETPMAGKTDRLVIRTDSRYTIYCVKNWSRRWESSGWKTSSGDMVKNVDMIHYLLSLLSLRATQGEIFLFEYIRTDSNSEGNGCADALAKRGLTYPIMPERDWLAGQERVESIETEIRSSKAFTHSVIPNPFRFVVEESDLLSSRELEELKRSQEF